MTSLVLLDSRATARRRFINNMADVVGPSNVKAFWLPSTAEGPTVADAYVPAVTWTHGTSLTGRVSALGAGAAISFNGSTDYLSTPDSAGYTFGNGVTDNAGGFSIFAVVNVTDTANQRDILTKFNAANEEFLWSIQTNDLSRFLLSDNTIPSQPQRISTASITQGSWTTLGASYSAATGGATAANDQSLYQAGVVFASSAINVATYVAMANTTSVLEIGSQSAHASGFFQGWLACVMLFAGGSTAKQTNLHQLSSAFLRLP